MIQLQSDEPVAALTARYVFPVAGPPIEGGIITIRGERIVAVGENLSGKPAVDLGNVAILPGLVNAHTHLEFSGLTRPLGPPGQSLPKWIRRVIEYRRTFGDGQPDAVISGLRQSVELGTTTLGEISTGGWPTDARRQCDATVFLEVLGLSEEAFLPRMDAAWAWAASDESRCAGRAGVSPHAPYSIPWRHLSRVFDIAWFQEAMVATHVAESQEELELLRSHGGPFRELFEELGVWDATAFPEGSRPHDFLRRFEVLEQELMVSATRFHAGRVLFIHGNYLDDDDIALLSGKRDRMSLVYCPRTHHYFRHEHYPLSAYLAAGVQMALGTDSRASNPDLSLLEEMRYVARHHQEVAPNIVLELGTRGGARALDVADETGTLEPGKLANFCVLPLPDRAARDPHELLFNSEAKVAITCWRGRKVYSEGAAGETAGTTDGSW